MVFAGLTSIRAVSYFRARYRIRALDTANSGHPAMNDASLPTVTRRKFLGAVGAAGAALGLGLPSSSQAAQSGKIPIGLELYSLREQCKTDLPGMLAAVAKIGYKGVEFAGYHGRSAQELRKMLDDNGIVACGTHTPYESVLGDKLKETVEFNRVIGNKFLIVPSMSAHSKQSLLERAELFNELADKVKPEGRWVGYHAHAHDFKNLEGETSWDIFSSHTRPEVRPSNRGSARSWMSATARTVVLTRWPC